MMDLDKVFENNKIWISNILSTDPDYFEQFRQGTKSRITIYWLFGQPGYGRRFNGHGARRSFCTP